MQRIMTRGSWEAMCWLRETYDPRLLNDFLRRKGSTLAGRDLAYWSLVSSGLQYNKVGGATPLWAVGDEDP